ncbi:hypothetical protein [Saccharopolyspora shandongensis]|uniref:hypothetical protein n=1 Tax=Saccharopolyspora shandongensis TaxID=418495 RepID=UPI0033E03D75
MAGMLFLLIIVVGGLALARLGKAAGCGPVGIGLLVIFGLAAIFGFLEAADLMD